MTLTIKGMFQADMRWFEINFLVLGYATEWILSSQVPCVQEITSNLATEPEQKINIKYFKYIIRRPPAEVTDDNAAILQLLDCLSNLDDAAEDGSDRYQIVLSRFIIGNGITKAMVDKYIVNFPLTAYKAIYDIELKFAAI